MAIVFPSNTREIINQIRDAIGRICVFQTVTYQNCVASGCTLDPITDTSTNSFCVVCSGLYHIPVYSGAEITAHVTWGQVDEQYRQTGGITYDGDCRLQIEHTDENLAIINSTSYVEVDGKKVEIKKTIPRGFQNLNRILLDCIELDD